MIWILRRLFYRLVYLRTAHWQRVRKNALALAQYRCQHCGAHKPLDIHHVNYKNLWHEEPVDVIALCRSCHQAQHAKK